MSVDKNYCMSSYLAFRYIEQDGKEFFPGLQHKNIVPRSPEERIPCRTAAEIDAEITRQFDGLTGKKIGIMLSGGIDSASLAAYMKGCDAYTFRFLGGSFQNEELSRAEGFAAYYNMKLHYVDIDWHTVEKYIDAVMRNKAAPVHSIEPQILQAALQAKEDGIELMIIGESSDLIFGGMDRLLSQDWTLEAFMKRYIFTDPADVLTEPVSVKYLFERYRKDGDKIDYLNFMDDIFSVESSSSYMNAFAVAGLQYLDPYAGLVMADPLDLYRVRHGEPKYLIRELFARKYPDAPIPFKTPMPRPVDAYFANWEGPTRPEFKSGLDMNSFTGNQKWQLWCLERFLNLYDPMP